MMMKRKLISMREETRMRMMKMVKKLMVIVVKMEKRTMVKSKTMKMEKSEVLLKVYSEPLFTGREKGGINPNP